MATFDEVFEGSEEAGKGEQPEQVAEVQQVETAPAQAEAGAETTAAETDTDKHVPLAALQAERQGRQDWKEKAIRFEEEVKQLRQQMEQRQQPQGEPQQLDPIAQVRQEMLNERFNMSEMVARQKYADIDEVLPLFEEAAKANPALAMQLQRQANPYEYAYREGKRIQMLKEVGEDPAAYRAKVEAEIRASLQPAATAPAAPHVPASLAGARSSASRSAPAFTGPTPIDSMFPN